MHETIPLCDKEKCEKRASHNIQTMVHHYTIDGTSGAYDKVDEWEFNGVGGCNQFLCDEHYAEEFESA